MESSFFSVSSLATGTTFVRDDLERTKRKLRCNGKHLEM